MWWRDEAVCTQKDADREAEKSQEPETTKVNQAEEHSAGRKWQTEEGQTGTVCDVAPSEDGEE